MDASGNVSMSGAVTATGGNIATFSIASGSIDSNSNNAKRGIKIEPGVSIRGYGDEAHTTVTSVGKFSFNAGGTIAPPAGGSTQFDPSKAPVPGNITA